MLQVINTDYARVRHYICLDQTSKKPRFQYHRQTQDYVEEYLRIANSRPVFDQIGQASIDPNLLDQGIIKQTGRACSSARTEHQPPKTIDWSQYKEFLSNKYGHQYAIAQYNNAIRYYELLSNPSGLMSLKPYSRANVLKALICLSKYLGIYLSFKEKLREHGIKWFRPDSFDSFFSIMNNNHKDLIDWYRNVQSFLEDNERLLLRFILLSGLRKGEGIQSFNLIIRLSKEGKLEEYFNEEFSMLEHYKFRQFLRGTKNAFISIIPKDLVLSIVNSKPVSYNAIHKKFYRRRIKIRIKELRSYYASFMVKHGIISEEVDLLQGRVSKSVFVRHYLKENPIDLRDRTLEALGQLEISLA
jgi:intergrase/recombinase